ncbi:thymidine kinase [Candidatus Gracilibacteria bacterium]|nr:thymidine kinase [Candidatus Gracilibacteria bacterium]
MAKLYYRYGAMGSSKTANTLMVRYNYLEKGQNPILLKPRAETRDGENILRSRIGLEAECGIVEDFIRDFDSKISHIDAIIIDEAHFLTKNQVDFFAQIADEKGIPVLCYGLRSDFKSELFAGSKRLFEIADVIEEIPTVCWCGKRAHFNARIMNGKIVREGEQFQLGGNESYVSLCRRHYISGDISSPL